MSYLLELLGRGLLANLWGAFPGTLEADPGADLDELAARTAARPDDPKAAVQYGVGLLRAGRAVAARDLFEKIAGSHDRHAPATIGLACALELLGQLEEAVTVLDRARTQDPESPAIQFCLGYLHELCGRSDQAVQHYNRSIEICPGLRNAHERLAAIAVRNGSIGQAVERYRLLCDWEPQQTDLHLTLASLLLQDGRANDAIARYQHALTLEPDNWVARDDMVSAYEKNGQYREAIEALHDMIEREPDFPDAFVRLGDMYALAGDDPSAMEYYTRALELHPEYLEATVKIGTQHLRSGRFLDAARWFTTALEINDRLLTAYVGLGVAQDAAGKPADCAETLDMAASIEPNSTLLFSEMARMQLKAAAAREAERYLSVAVDEPPVEDASRDLLEEQVRRHRDAVARSPSQADLHYRLGLLLRHQGDSDAAGESFEQALAINPTYVKALIKLGLLRLEQDRWDNGVTLLKKAVELEPNYVDLHYQLGLAFARRQQFGIAVEHFEQAVAGNPSNADFQANLALALQQMGLIDRASACWEAVRALAPDSAYAEQARRFRLEDRFSGARSQEPDLGAAAE